MPYRNKEERTAAVRRHREKKKGLAEALALEAQLRDILREVGFTTISWDDLVEITQEFTKDEDGVWRRKKDGKRIYPPGEVFFLLDTMVIW